MQYPLSGLLNIVDPIPINVTVSNFTHLTCVLSSDCLNTLYLTVKNACIKIITFVTLL